VVAEFMDAPALIGPKSTQPDVREVRQGAAHRGYDGTMAFPSMNRRCRGGPVVRGPRQC
jgi:hypothetical protein